MERDGILKRRSQCLLARQQAPDRCWVVWQVGSRDKRSQETKLRHMNAGTVKGGELVVRE